MPPWPGLHQASALTRTSLRQNPCPCAILRSLFRQGPAAAYSTSPRPETSLSDASPDSLFSQHNSPWDEIFEGIDNFATVSAITPKDPLRYSQNAQRRPSRSQFMTAREKNAFQDMFDMVFNAAEKLKDGQLPSEAPKFTVVHGVGTTPKSREMADLFSRLQKNVKRMRWTTEIDEELDRKKEEIELCDTDVHLLEWATNEVFRPHQPTATSAQGQATSAQNNQLYPHLISALMRAFRDRFHDPHLALAIFDHAKNLSIYSYVFGCTAPAYNELIETQWFCFHDLKGILDTLEEMKVNGVDPDNRTRRIIENVRRDAPTMRLLEEEDYFGKGQDNVMHILTQVEALLRKPSLSARSTTISRKTRPETSWSERWKYGVEEKSKRNENSEDWSWGNWGPRPVRQSTRFA